MRPLGVQWEVLVKCRLLLLAALGGLIAQSALAQPAPGSPIDIGPAVGKRIPLFAAIDSKGMTRAFASLPGAKGVVLVFFRSAKWCPFCQLQLIDLKKVEQPLEKRGYGLVAISYDTPQVLTAFAEKQDINYTLLSDGGSKMIDAFGLRDPQYPVGSFAYGVPKPSIFILDRRGVIRAKLALEGYKVRPSNDAILGAVDTVR
jgi:peroxiredoxin